MVAMSDLHPYLRFYGLCVVSGWPPSGTLCIWFLKCMITKLHNISGLPEGEDGSELARSAQHSTPLKNTVSHALDFERSSLWFFPLTCSLWCISEIFIAVNATSSSDDHGNCCLKFKHNRKKTNHPEEGYVSSKGESKVKRTGPRRWLPTQRYYASQRQGWEQCDRKCTF